MENINIYEIDKTSRQKVGVGKNLMKSYSYSNKIIRAEFSWTEGSTMISLNIDVVSNLIQLFWIKGSDYIWPTEILNNIKNKSNVAFQFLNSHNSKEAIKELAKEMGSAYTRIYCDKIKNLLEECERSAALNFAEKKELWKVVLKVKGEDE